MAAENGELQLKITLDDGSIVDGFLSIEKKSKQTAGQIENNMNGGFEKLAASAKTLAVAFAGVFATQKIVGFLKDSTAAAADAEKSNVALAASLAQIGKFSAESVSKFDQFAGQLQRLTGVEDDLIKKNAAFLASVGKLSGDGLERATKASLDLAAALQVSAESGFDMVAKAANGNVTALSKYGIKVDETVPKAERFANVLAQIEKNFGGLAGTNLNTFDGIVRLVGLGFGEITEAVGGFITQSPALRVLLKSISELFFDVADSINKFRESSGDVFKPIITGAINVALFFNEFVKAIELGFNYLTIGVKTVILGFNALAALIAQVPAFVTEYMMKPILDFVGFMADKVVGFFNAEAGAKLKAGIQGFGNVLTTETGLMADNATQVMIDSFDSLAESADGNYMSMSMSMENWLTNLKTGVEQASEITSGLKNNIDTNLAETTNKISEHAKNINAAFSQGIVNVISSGSQAIGKALGKGTFSAQEFGNMMLGIFGDLAIQLGTLMISFGIGINSLAQSLASFNGFAAIAAGAALVAIGAAIKSLSTADSAASAGVGAAGGGVATTPSQTTELNQPDQLQKVDDSPKVQVVIQGDVLDSDESGSRIIDLINKNFGKKGTVLNQGVT